MKKEYKISDIIIGTLVTNQLIGGQIGYTITKEDRVFFFCKQELESDCLQRYMELFAGDIRRVYKLSDNIETQKFNRTYVNEIDDIRNYLTEEELSSKTISDKRLIEIYKNYNIIKKENKTNIIPMAEIEERDKQLIKMPQLIEKQA